MDGRKAAAMLEEEQEAREKMSIYEREEIRMRSHLEALICEKEALLTELHYCNTQMKHLEEMPIKYRDFRIRASKIAKELNELAKRLREI